MEYIMFFLIMAIAIGAIVIAIRSNDAKMNKLVSEGKGAKRERTFWMQQTTFTTTISSLDNVYSAINKTVLNEVNIECTVEPSVSVMFSQKVSGGGFVATLAVAGENGGKSQYTYQVDGYKGPNGYWKPTCLRGANILLTAIEKAFLQLDRETALSRRTASFKQK